MLVYGSVPISEGARGSNLSADVDLVAQGVAHDAT